MDTAVEVKPAKKVGRPRIIVDYEAVERLARQLCDQKLVCQILHLNYNTATHDEEFIRAWNDGRADACTVLLAKQMELAKTGNPKMLEWLGKNILRQSDKVDVNIEGRVTIVINGDDANV